MFPLTGLLAFAILKEPYTRLEAIVGFTSMIGVIFIAKPSFLFTPPPLDPNDPLDNVTPQQRTSAVLVALMGVCGAAGAYLIIRVIGKRASAMHSIQYFSTYSVLVSCMYPIFFDSPAVIHLSAKFFILLVPIGVLGFVAQVLLTNGLQRERAGRGTLAVCAFRFSLTADITHRLTAASERRYSTSLGDDSRTNLLQQVP